MAISARDDSDWLALSRAMGHPEWGRDPRFQSLDSRLQQQGALDRMMEEWTCSRNPREAMDTLQVAGVPAAQVQHPEDRIDHDENTRHWGLWPEVVHSEMGPVHVEGGTHQAVQVPGPLQPRGSIAGRGQRIRIPGGSGAGEAGVRRDVQ